MLGCIYLAHHKVHILLLPPLRSPLADEILHLLACAGPASGCGQPCGSFPRAPTDAGDFRSDPETTEHAAAVGVDGDAGHVAAAEEQNDENEDSASFAPGAASVDEGVDSDSWRWDDSVADWRDEVH